MTDRTLGDLGDQRDRGAHKRPPLDLVRVNYADNMFGDVALLLTVSSIRRPEVAQSMHNRRSEGDALFKPDLFDELT